MGRRLSNLKKDAQRWQRGKQRKQMPGREWQIAPGTYNCSQLGRTPGARVIYNPVRWKAGRKKEREGRRACPRIEVGKPWGQREAARAPKHAGAKHSSLPVFLEWKERGRRQAGEMEWGGSSFISVQELFLSPDGDQSHWVVLLPRGVPAEERRRRQEAEESAWLGRSWLRGARGSWGGASLLFHCPPSRWGSWPPSQLLHPAPSRWIEGKLWTFCICPLGTRERQFQWLSLRTAEQSGLERGKGERVSTLSWRMWVCSTFSYFASISTGYLNTQKHESVELMRWGTDLLFLDQCINNDSSNIQMIWCPVLELICPAVINSVNTQNEKQVI